MAWWQPPLRLDSWKPIQSWSLILQWKQTLTQERNYELFLPAVPNTCLKILASCDRYYQGSEVSWSKVMIMEHLGA
ncbi:hypothetical protein IGI04_002129 [Brassica rapa subsp. trilocularis]|uniref:Uncharacterized protein n=1 Tax=Brassica rapa subsp. trilocularis TaxID=1813537 RepID=A0ABQ7NUN7_BRACM|nr:hypothetical protein IGI04_002129 [Brassica rapa subsp. trilocularis]